MSLDKRYLTPKELVERYNGEISLRTLANWRSGGYGPPYTKVGGIVFYPIERLDEWENQNTFEAGMRGKGAKK